MSFSCVLKYLSSLEEEKNQTDKKNETDQTQ